MPLPSTSRLRLVPRLPRSVGFLPVFFPPEGRLGHAPVHTQPGPVDALPVIVGHQAGFPHAQENAVTHPALEAVVRGGTGAEAGGIQRFPLAAGAQDEEDGFHADTVGGRWFAAAEGVGVHPLGDQSSDGLPQVVGNTPLVHHPLFRHGWASWGWFQLLKEQAQLHQGVVAIQGLSG
jgi:hypothetical protein